MDESPVTTKLIIRKSYDLKEKQNAVTMIDELVSSGNVQRKACASAGIPYLYYRRWKKLIEKVDGINDGKKFVSYNTKGTSRCIHQGHSSMLNGIYPTPTEDFYFSRSRAGYSRYKQNGCQRGCTSPSILCTEDYALQGSVHPSLHPISWPHPTCLNAHGTKAFHAHSSGCKGLHRHGETEIGREESQ